MSGSFNVAGEVWGLACCGGWLVWMCLWRLVIGREFLVVGGGAGEIGFWLFGVVRAE